MAMTVNEIMTLDGQLLPFSRDLREALGVYARRTWPLHTSVHAAKAWGISKSTAANLLKGHASDATVTTIIRAGGWALALPVIGAVIGHGLDEAITAERRNDIARAHRRRALVRDLRALAPDHSGPGPELADRRRVERRSFSRRMGQGSD